MLKQFVAYFVEDFVKLLKKRGWVILSDKVVMKTMSPEHDLKKALGGKLPDVLVFFWVHNNLLKRWSRGLSKMDLTTAFFAEDMHHPEEKKAMKIASGFTDAIMVRYKEAAEHFMKNIKIHPPVYQISHAAADVFFIPIKWSRKKRLCLLSGANDYGYYPLRNEAEELMEEGFDLIVRRKHPGYNKIRDGKTEAKNYAKAIGAYMLAIADAGVVPKNPHPYTLAKTFEICAAGTAMVTHTRMKPYLKKMGFKPGVNYIEADAENLEDVVEKWLDPSKEGGLKKITAAGQKLVKEHHTNLHRVEEFEKRLSSIFATKNEQVNK